MNERSFLQAIPALVKAKLPKALQGIRTANGYALIKIFYGNPKLHYEVAVRAKVTLVEVGLHFESDGLTNAQLIGAFRTHERAIQKALPAGKLEEWDKGWTRIWEPVEYETFDGALQREVVTRVVSYIRTLEPILREELPANVDWTPPKARASRPRSRPRKRAAASG